MFDDDAIRVVWHPGDAAIVLVTFADMIFSGRALDFFAAGPVRKAGIACAGITAKAANWYPEDSMRAAAMALRPLLAQTGRHVLYGGSMGGYAALKFSFLFGATTVIALCPQWSIDPAECEGQDPGFQNFFSPLMAGMGVRESDIAGDIFVFADGGDPQEEFHCRMIARACPDMALIQVPMAGHHVTSIFAGSENLRRLIDTCVARDMAALKVFVRDTRRRHWIRLEEIILRSKARHARPLAEIVAARAPNERHVAALGAKHLLRLAADCLRSGHAELSARLIMQFRDGLDDPHSQIAAASAFNRMAGSETRIVTHHATRLIFDVSTRTCRHKSGIADAFETELRLHMTGASATLFADAAGLRIDLCLDDHGVLGDGSGQPATSFAIASPRPGSFTLRHGDFFLSAERGGAVVCNRTEAADWELFRAR